MFQENLLPPSSGETNNENGDSKQQQCLAGLLQGGAHYVYVQ